MSSVFSSMVWGGAILNLCVRKESTQKCNKPMSPHSFLISWNYKTNDNQHIHHTVKTYPLFDTTRSTCSDCDRHFYLQASSNRYWLILPFPATASEKVHVANPVTTKWLILTFLHITLLHPNYCFTREAEEGATRWCQRWPCKFTMA